MSMLHNSLLNYYERIFALKQYHNWSIKEIEEMIPWELDVMMTLLSNFLEQQELQRKQAQVSR